MSIGTASSANTPTPSTKPAGTSATPEKYPFRNQRASSNPGASNRNRAAATVTPGTVARASRNGPTAARAAPGEVPFRDPAGQQQPGREQQEQGRRDRDARHRRQGVPKRPDRRERRAAQERDAGLEGTKACPDLAHYPPGRYGRRGETPSRRGR